MFEAKKESMISIVESTSEIYDLPEYYFVTSDRTDGDYLKGF